MAAETEATARRACRLIEVEYEELPAVLDARGRARAAARRSSTSGSADYVKVFDAGTKGNSARAPSSRKATSTRPGRECDLVVEGEFQTQAQAHLAIEPCGALAEVDAAGRVTLWSANQSVFRVQANVCESLGLPMTRLRCLTPRVGGGFGNKMEAHVQPIAVKLALSHAAHRSS